MFQRARFKLIAYVALFIIALAVLSWWFSYNRAKGRDYERLVEMKVLAAQLNNYFFHFNTYQIPQCQVNTLVNFCLGKNGRIIKIDHLIDPINKNQFQYLVSDLSDDNFQVNFAFEVGVGGLRKGNYVLTKEGISK